MKDYDIKVRGRCEITFFGTDNDTIIVPSNVKFDSDRDSADIDIEAGSNVTIGIPCEAEHVELDVMDSNISIKDLSFEKLEIDAKGRIEVKIENVKGPIDINMVSGEAVLKVPEGYSFRTNREGKNNFIECSIPQDISTDNVIELNLKNSVLKIVTT